MDNTLDEFKDNIEFLKNNLEPHKVKELTNSYLDFSIVYKFYQIKKGEIETNLKELSEILKHFEEKQEFELCEKVKEEMKKYHA